MVRAAGLRHRRWFAILVVVVATGVSTFGSSIVVGAQATIAAAFGARPAQQPLLVALYLVGCAAGPMVFAPVSESWSKRGAVSVGTGLQAVFTLAVPHAPTWSAVLAFRLLAGLGSASVLCVSSAIVADVVPDAAGRGLITAWLIVGATVGSALGAIVSLQLHATAPARWELGLWINGAMATAAALGLLALPGSGRRPDRPKVRHCGADLSIFIHILRCWRFMLSEPVITISAVYLSMIYAIYYLYFQVLPDHFARHCAFSAPRNSLIFAALLVGVILAGLVQAGLDPVLRRSAEWPRFSACRPEITRLPPLFLGSVGLAVSLFAIGRATPVGAPSSCNGILISVAVCGLSMVLVYIGVTNYTVDMYQTLAASALAPAFSLRNLAAACLTLAASKPERALGPRTLYYVMGACCIPFVFLPLASFWIGPRLRTRPARAERDDDGPMGDDTAGRTRARARVDGGDVVPDYAGMVAVKHAARQLSRELPPRREAFPRDEYGLIGRRAM